VGAGVLIECEEVGAGDRPFVLVHGFTGSRLDWLEQLPALASIGRTLTPDQRGHGGSTNTGDAASYTLDQLVRDLGLALTALDVPRCDLLGHSMGGMVALRFALAHPERVASLVLMDTAARGLEIMPRQLMESGAALARQSGMSVLAKIMREGARSGERTAPAARKAIETMGFEAWWDRVQTKLEQMDPEAFAALGRTLVEQEPVSERLGEIRCPTTVIVGEQDVAFLEPSAELARGIPDAVQVTIPDAAHSPQIENATRWIETIRGHLGRARA
jgi:2-succinyl-6-hydroxy-2,4-cyclohexadiene-1-carboxylate synthase